MFKKTPIVQILSPGDFPALPRTAPASMIDRKVFERYYDIAAVESDRFEKIEERRRYNAALAGYFRELADCVDDRSIVLQHAKNDSDVLRRQADQIEHCSEYLDFAVYSKDKVMDYLRANRCHSRYCANCVKMIQASRLQNFYPAIRATFDKGAVLYGVTFTIPNIAPEILPYSLDVMNEIFFRLFKFLDGRAKIRGLELCRNKCIAAVRSFEVTYNNKTRLLHPHIHGILAFEHELEADQDKHHVNKYSFDYGKLVCKFSDFEILLQKLWRLLYDRVIERDMLQEQHDNRAKANTQYMLRKIGVKVPLPIDEVRQLVTPDDIFNPPKKRTVKARRITLEDINALPIGYSCKLDRLSEDAYLQAFKYAFKLEDDDHEFMQFDTFVALYDGLFGRRLIQGYGEWFDVDTSDTINDDCIAISDCILDYLQSRQSPEYSCFTPLETITFVRDNNYRVFSRKALNLFLREDLSERERAAMLEELERYKAARAQKQIDLREYEQQSMAKYFSRMAAYYKERKQSLAEAARRDQIFAYVNDIHLVRKDAAMLEYTQQMRMALDEIF